MKHKTKSGKEIEIKDMSVSHLINCIKLFYDEDKEVANWYWVCLQYKLLKLSWGKELIKNVDKKFYRDFIERGRLTKKIYKKNGIPFSWELEEYYGITD